MVVAVAAQDPVLQVRAADYKKLFSCVRKPLPPGRGFFLAKRKAFNSWRQPTDSSQWQIYLAIASDQLTTKGACRNAMFPKQLLYYYLQETHMFEITKTALENLKSYLHQNNTESSIRIALMQGGCAGPALGLALDEVKDNDTTFQEDTLSFLIENELLSTCGAVKIDFVEADHGSGFSITSTNPVGGGGGCSSGSCASGSCCS